MTMPTIHTGGELHEVTTLELAGTSFHYLVRVLRLRPGDKVRLIAPSGQQATGRLVDKENSSLVIAVEELHEAPASRAGSFALACSPLKHGGAEQIAAFAAELSVERLLVVPMTRSVARLPADRLPRLQRVADETARKVGLPPATRVELRTGLSDLLDHCADWSCYFLCTEGEVMLSSVTISPAEKVLLVVGPEGDFTREERSLLTSRGAIPLRLAGPFYRAPTAAAIGITLLRFIAGRI